MFDRYAKVWAGFKIPLITPAFLQFAVEQTDQAIRSPDIEYHVRTQVSFVLIPSHPNISVDGEAYNQR